MNTILKAHSDAWLDSRAYRWVWLGLPLSTIAMVVGLLYGITPDNGLRLLPYPKEYSQQEETEIVAALKSDTPGSLKKLRDAAADEDPRAINLLGELYRPQSRLKGFVPPDFDQAMVYYEKAAAMGSAVAMYNAALLHGDNNDLEKACDYQKKATDAGRNDPDTIGRAGYCLVTLPKSSAAEKVKGLEMLNLAASSGHGYAFYLLGSIYDKSPYLDMPRAIEYYEKAIAHKANDWGNSRLILADIFFYGLNGTPHDFAKAKFHYEKSFAEGHSMAAFRLAHFYRNDRGNVKADRKKSFEFSKIAARNNIPTAHYNLYIHYINGDGTARNVDMAANHLLNAISLGDKLALEKATKGEPTLSSEIIVHLQQKLAVVTMYSGPFNGVSNPGFRSALESLPGKGRHFGPRQ